MFTLVICLKDAAWYKEKSNPITVNQLHWMLERYKANEVMYQDLEHFLISEGFNKLADNRIHEFDYIQFMRFV